MNNKTKYYYKKKLLIKSIIHIYIISLDYVK